MTCDTCTPRSTLRPPSDPNLPMVVYGSLRKRELAHGQIEAHVDRVETANLDGYSIVVDDGLPFLEHVARGPCHVDLVWLMGSGYEAVCSFEPPRLYKWSTCQVQGHFGAVTANVLIARESLSDGADHDAGEWTSAGDPLLSSGLVAVREILLQTVSDAHGTILRSPKQDAAFWLPLMRFEAAYLLMWSVIERYATFRYGAGSQPEQRITQLGDDPLFKRCAVEAGVPAGLRVRDSRGNGGSKRTEVDGTNAGRYFRQIRNNMTHRGKAAYKDAELVIDASRLCFNTTRLLLLESMPSIADQWKASVPGGVGLQPITSDDFDPLFG
jgi:hypothetical protein